MDDKKIKLSPTKRKWLVRVLVIVVVVLAFLIGRAYQQDYLEEKLRSVNPSIKMDNNAAANGQWRTYTDPTSKLSFQYPTGWQISHSAKDFVISKPKSRANITFMYPNNPKAAAQTVASGVTQKIAVGKEQVVFTDYYVGLGDPATAFAHVGGTTLGGHIAAIAVSVDGTSDKADTQTFKQILASLK